MPLGTPDWKLLLLPAHPHCHQGGFVNSSQMDHTQCNQTPCKHAMLPRAEHHKLMQPVRKGISQHAPQQTIPPSFIMAHVCEAPAATWVTPERPLGTLHWPSEFLPAGQRPAPAARKWLVHLPRIIYCRQPHQCMNAAAAQRTPAGDGAILPQGTDVRFSSGNLDHAGEAAGNAALAFVIAACTSRCRICAFDMHVKYTPYKAARNHAR